MIPRTWATQRFLFLSQFATAQCCGSLPAFPFELVHYHASARLRVELRRPTLKLVMQATPATFGNSALRTRPPESRKRSQREAFDCQDEVSSI